MDIPEEEIEQAIIWDLSLLKLRPNGKLKLVARQRPLKTSDGFIDLLLEDGKRYYIVELKRDLIKHKSIVTDQVLRYKTSLMQEMNLPSSKFTCVLASPQGLLDDVKELCRINHVIPKTLDEDRIVDVLSSKSRELQIPSKEETIYKIIFERRLKFNREKISEDKIQDEAKSVLNWVTFRQHDYLSKQRIASLFRDISSKAPIEAHQVPDAGRVPDNYRLETFTDQWFWLFYTCLDKRSNASTFIKAKRILETNHLFMPQDIIRELEKYGKDIVVDRITTLLEQNRFPLLHDFVLGKFAVATSIVSAAQLIEKFNYSFDTFYNHYKNLHAGNLDATLESIQQELDTIHGVGPRMRSQFVRGMVLKGNWKLPLKDNSFLEKSRFNTYFAGPARFSLISNEEDYEKDLSIFADEYLEGNKAIVSHTLWFVRKKYCGKAKHCQVCPFAGYCSYYLKTNIIKAYNENQEFLIKWIPYPLKLDDGSKSDLDVFQNS